MPALGFALFLAAPASAEVDYVRDIVQPDGMARVVPAPQAPYETSSPDYSTPASPTPYFVTTTQYYSLDSSTGVVARGIGFPSAFKLNQDSVGAFAGQNTPASLFFTVTALSTLQAFNLSRGQILSPTPPLDAGAFTSLAARNRDGNLLSLIADNQHFTANRTTGELIAQPLTGVDMSAAFYQSYGQDGLLHVLDYGHSRMASFDPDNAFAPVGGFDLNTSPGITTANVQFGIGLNGSFYLADGLGGGSYYNAAGVFQGTFALPGGAVADSYTGASYVSTDSAGRVYVFDSATGIHQFQDTAITAVPEPATYAAGIAGLLGTIIFLRRRRLLNAMPIRTLAAAALGFFLANASAQVDYVRDIVQPGGMARVVPAPQAPYETSSPDYSTPATPKSYFVTTTSSYSLDSSTGAVAPARLFPASIKQNDNSVAAFAGQNTALLFFTVSSQRFLLTFNVTTRTVVSQTPILEADVFSSLAARNRDGNLFSLIADNEHFTANRTTGELIAQPLTGVDMSAAFYQSYGQDGLLHVLDYGHSRMASFDPDNAFAPAGGFDLMTGITTANVQFGIGLNGSFYLADGLGGGSYYNAAGAFQGTFALPEDAVADSYTGASYVSTDSAGRVYVFDSATGIHQFQDTAITAVPEPATYVIGIAGLLGVVILLRRHRGTAR
jgi:hypothetical protein